MRAAITLLLAGLLMVAHSSTMARQEPSVVGVWRVAAVTHPAGVLSQPQPGLFIFTKTHYSIVRVASELPRPALGNPNEATAAELLAVFGNSFVASSGTYGQSPGAVTIRPIVAKSPSSMLPTSSNTFTVKWQGDDLILGAGPGGGTLYQLERLE
jgi:hypothetical protein